MTRWTRQRRVIGSNAQNHIVTRTTGTKKIARPCAIASLPQGGFGISGGENEVAVVASVYTIYTQQGDDAAAVFR